MRVITWCGRHLDAFTSEMMKAGGKTAGIALGSSPIWLTFGHQLVDAATAIMQWLMTLLPGAAGPG
jgi:hypothetical protein